MLTELGTDLLKRTGERIQRNPPVLNMHQWYTQNPDPQRAELIHDKEPECNTVGCIAAWVTHLWREDVLDHKIPLPSDSYYTGDELDILNDALISVRPDAEQVAPVLLGLTKSACDELFIAAHWPTELSLNYEHFREGLGAGYISLEEFSNHAARLACSAIDSFISKYSKERR